MAAARRAGLLLMLAWLASLAGCVRMPSTDVTPLKPATPTELKTYLLDHKPDVDQFRDRGPFEVITREDVELRLSAAERFTGDLYLSTSGGQSPLVIFVHGYDSSKEDHAYQAFHLATWGMHSLSLQLPNRSQWASNGSRLAKIAHLIRKNPQVLDQRIDGSKIILIGHSFGGASVATALAEGAPAVGAVLLDPASVGRALPNSLGKIDKPVLVLGADRRVSAARGRANFYRYIRSGVAEVSVRDATHEDAQFPMEATPVTFGGDSYQTEEHQVTFVSAMTAGAFSLASTGGLDYAWASFGDPGKNKRFFDPRKK